MMNQTNPDQQATTGQPERSIKMTAPAKGLSWRLIVGILIVLILAIAAWWVTKQVYALKLPLGIPGKALEFPLWAVLVGLVGNLVLKVAGVHGYARPGFRTELFLKIGLVLLGAGISFKTMVSAAKGAVIQGPIMVLSVFFFCWWLAGVFKIDLKLRAVMATAVSICGVSAAIAAAGSVLAKKEQVTYVTTLVILTALPLMVLMPVVATAFNLPQDVAGAWFGGNIDTTAAVVGAGTIYGERAQTVATVVKSTQNALIGLVAFLLALYFVTFIDRKSGEKPSPRLIWDRFPKFVLGFIVASILYTLGIIDGGKGTVIEALKNWSFTLAFVCMGLEFSAQELKRMGWAPLIVFLVVTVFNTLLALIVSYLLFGLWFPVA